MLLLPGFCSAPEILLLGEGLQIDPKLFWHARLTFPTRLKRVLQGLGQPHNLVTLGQVGEDASSIPFGCHHQVVVDAASVTSSSSGRGS